MPQISSARSLLAVLFLFFLASGCHLNLLLEGEGAPCETDDNCPADQHCFSQQCVVTEIPTQDAGSNTDTGLGDTAISDAGIVVDTRLNDTGLNDAAVNDDHNIPDSASPDNGPLDAGFVDLDLFDAELPDSSSFDATVGPELIVTNAGPVEFIVVSDNALFWTVDQSAAGLRTAELDGDNQVALASVVVGKPYALAVDSDHVFFSTINTVTNNQDKIFSLDRHNLAAAKVEIASGRNLAPDVNKNLICSGGLLFWLEHGNGFYNEIFSYNSSRTGDETIAGVTLSSYPTGLAFFNNTLFWHESQKLSTLPWDFVDQQEAQDTDVVVDQALFAAGANSSAIFWSTKKSGQGSKILHFDPNLFNLTTFVSPAHPEDPNAQVLDLAVDDTDLFYTTDGNPSTLFRFRLGLSDDPEIVATGDDLWGVAINDDFVFWADHGLGEIHRQAR